MIHTHTMTQLKSAQEPMRLLSSGAITSTTSLSNEVPSASPPASTANYVVIPASTLSYIKIAPYISSVANAVTIRVTGWSKTSDATPVYVPMILFQGTISAIGATSTTVAGGTLYPALTIAKLATPAGDAKINVAAAGSCANILVDTLGSQLVKIEIIAATSAITYNAFIGAL